MLWFVFWRATQGLSHPHHALAKLQMKGFGGMVAFVVERLERIDVILDDLNQVLQKI
ncbi:MAG: hypothetical protein ACOX87_07540 [Chloroflexota bacterium]|jgi:cystathionine beta-lyase/cystathionine gamma-synthase